MQIERKVNKNEFICSVNINFCIYPIIDELKQKYGINKEEETSKERINDLNFFKSLKSIIMEKLNGKTIEEFKKIIENWEKNKSKLEVLFKKKVLPKIKRILKI